MESAGRSRSSDDEPPASANAGVQVEYDHGGRAAKSGSREADPGPVLPGPGQAKQRDAVRSGGCPSWRELLLFVRD